MSMTTQEYEGKTADLREQGIVPVRPEVTRAVAVCAVSASLFWVTDAVIALCNDWKRMFSEGGLVSLSSSVLSHVVGLILAPAVAVVVGSVLASLLQTRFFFHFAFGRTKRVARLTDTPLPLYIKLLVSLLGLAVGYVILVSQWGSLWRALYSPRELLGILGLVWSKVALGLGSLLLMLSILLWLRQKKYVGSLPLEEESH